jgi:hypothetical protein
MNGDGDPYRPSRAGCAGGAALIDAPDRRREMPCSTRDDPTDATAQERRRRARRRACPAVEVRRVVSDVPRRALIASQREDGGHVKRRLNCTWRRWIVAGIVAVVVSAGAALYLASPDAEVAPITGLRQLDLLYLDEPAPALDRLGVEPGRPAVVLFCDPACGSPNIAGAQVVHSSDPDLAARYALLTARGRVGPGYALVDATGRLRYRTFDPAPAAHAEEIQILVDAVSTAR